MLKEKHLIEELTRLCLDALPHKAFGLVGGDDVYHSISYKEIQT